MRHNYLIITALSAVIFGMVGTAQSFCFEQAGREYGISPDLLVSISKHESNFKPSAVNWNTNGTYDFGPMQINSSWEPTLRKAGLAWSSLADPCTNVRVGAWILSQCFAKYGNTWKGVGCYNSRTPSKRDNYAQKIAGIYNKMSKNRLYLEVPRKEEKIITDREQVNLVWADNTVTWEKDGDVSSR